MNKFYNRNKGLIVSGAAILLLGLCFLGTNTPSVLADDASTGNTAAKAAQEVTPPAATPAPATEPTLGLLMSALDKLGLAKPLSKFGINIYGYIEGGFMHDFSAPHKGGATFIGYNNFKNSGVLDKADLSIERTVDPTKKQFDIGFHLEGLYGADADLIHSNGMWAKQTGHYQGDLLQAYLDVALPGMPVKIRVGKWIELAGFEQYSANIYSG